MLNVKFSEIINQRCFILSAQRILTKHEHFFLVYFDFFTQWADRLMSPYLYGPRHRP